MRNQLVEISMYRYQKPSECCIYCNINHCLCVRFALETCSPHCCHRHCFYLMWIAILCLIVVGFLAFCCPDSHLQCWYTRVVRKISWQNGAIPFIFKIGKIRNVRFVGNLILNMRENFFDADVIVVTSSVNRSQSVCVLFSLPVITHKWQRDWIDEFLAMPSC